MKRELSSIEVTVSKRVKIRDEPKERSFLFTELPVELLMLIARQLDLRSLFTLGKTCATLRAWVRNFTSTWAPAYYFKLAIPGFEEREKIVTRQRKHREESLLDLRRKVPVYPATDHLSLLRFLRSKMDRQCCFSHLTDPAGKGDKPCPKCSRRPSELTLTKTNASKLFGVSSKHLEPYPFIIKAKKHLYRISDVLMAFHFEKAAEPDEFKTFREGIKQKERIVTFFSLKHIRDRHATPQKISISDSFLEEMASRLDCSTSQDEMIHRIVLGCFCKDWDPETPASLDAIKTLVFDRVFPGFRDGDQFEGAVMKIFNDHAVLWTLVSLWRKFERKNKK